MTSTLLPLIAIDGPSASGKGTLARRLAAHFDFAYLDTGLLYRAVGMMARDAGVSLNEASAIADFAQRLDMAALLARLDDAALRGDGAAQAASKVAAVPEVRAALLQFQRDFFAHPPGGKKGAVLDGRDIGTVIAPHAMVKIFVTADVATRAQRRHTELLKTHAGASYDDVLADLQARDERDASRSAAPSKPAEDAVILDTTTLNAEQAFAAALDIAQQKI